MYKRQVINYMTISGLGWLDTYMAAIAPNIATTLGLFLITNYMTTIPDTLLEAAKIDGCSEFRIYWSIIMPICKPAWLTLVIIMFQNIWGQTHTAYIYKEAMKTLPYALTQITPVSYTHLMLTEAVLDPAEDPMTLYKEGKWDWAAFENVVKKTTKTNSSGEVTQWGVGGG